MARLDDTRKASLRKALDSEDVAGQSVDLMVLDDAPQTAADVSKRLAEGRFGRRAFAAAADRLARE